VILNHSSQGQSKKFYTRVNKTLDKEWLDSLTGGFLRILKGWSLIRMAGTYP
jgi:hypothetical protein